MDHSSGPISVPVLLDSLRLVTCPHNVRWILFTLRRKSNLIEDFPSLSISFQMMTEIG